jgi:hypothetical protein
LIITRHVERQSAGLRAAPLSGLGILNVGETFYEPPTAVHSVSRNPSTDKRTKIIVFMVADQKNPSTVAE